MLRRVGQLGEGAGQLTRALAILGGPAPLRHAAALSGLDLARAARLADQLRAADVLAAGSTLEFAHPIVRTAIYEAIPPGERALAHAEAALLLDREGADAERVALHLLRSEPSGDSARHRRAARGRDGGQRPRRPGHGCRSTFAARSKSHPIPRPGPRCCWSWDSPWPATAVPRRWRSCGRQSSWPGPGDRAAAALMAARVLGIWGYHDGVIAICRDALAGRRSGGRAGGRALRQLLHQHRHAGAGEGAGGSRLADPGASAAWRVYDALVATAAAQPASDALARLAPVLSGGLPGISPDSLTAVYALLVLIWNDELATAGRICDTVLAAARARGSMSIVAHASCLRSMIMRRLGRLEDAAADARLGLDFKLATSPPLAVAWAAAFCIEALTGLAVSTRHRRWPVSPPTASRRPAGFTRCCSCRRAGRCGSRRT